MQHSATCDAFWGSKHECDFETRSTAQQASKYATLLYYSCKLLQTALVCILDVRQSFVPVIYFTPHDKTIAKIPTTVTSFSSSFRVILKQYAMTTADSLKNVSYFYTFVCHTLIIRDHNYYLSAYHAINSPIPSQDAA